MATPELAAQKRILERTIRAREFVFGIQAGLLSTVGLLSGVSAATESRAIVILTGIAATITGGVSMATGSYLAARTEEEISSGPVSSSLPWRWGPPSSGGWWVPSSSGLSGSSCPSTRRGRAREGPAVGPAATAPRRG